MDELVDLVRGELAGYLQACSVAGVGGLPTRCPPWDVAGLTAHLAATFERFGALLARARSSDLAPPFPPEMLAAENLRAVAEFDGDPVAALRLQAGAFLDAVGDPAELTAHQRGPIPVELQLRFALDELAIHHDDVAAATGGAYRPSPAVLDVLVPVWRDVVGGLPADEPDPWRAVLLASGRAV